MLSFAKLSALFALVVVAVHAQDESATDSVDATGTDTAGGTIPTDIPACITTCATDEAAAAECPDVTDVTCVCTNTAYQTAVATCITNTCPDQLAAAQQVQQQQCAALGAGSASGTMTGTSSRAASSGAAATSSHAASGTATHPSTSGTSTGASSGASAASTSNAASGQVGGMDYAKVMTGAVLVAGVLVGGNMLL